MRARRLRAIATVIAVSMVALSGAAHGIEVRKIRPEAPDDETLIRSIAAHVAGRAGVDASRVHIAAESGAITLKGACRTLRERSEIERLAAQVRGVESVENEILVDRTDSGDELLRLEAERALRLVPRLAVMRLTVTVADGIASIEGLVPIAIDRDRAEEAVSAVSGIVGIRNDLGIDAPAVDPAVLSRRVRRILADRRLFGGVEDLEVLSEPEGRITLRGAAVTHSDRMRAEKLVYGLSGVRTVVNELSVRRRPGSAPP